MARPSYVYVASSWRNKVHANVCATLREAGIDHYDFKNPPGGTGFSWKEVKTETPSVDLVPCVSCGGRGTLRGEQCGCGAGVSHVVDCGRPPRTCPDCMFAGRLKPKGSDWEQVGEYLRMIEHRRAIDGFASDFAAMERADTFVMVLPCGKSAHLELGWAVGAGKRTAILLEDPVEPELMYRMVDHLAIDLPSLMVWLRA